MTAIADDASVLAGLSAASPASAHAIERHSKSFSLASKLLPPEFRQDARRLYAWCRRADDAVDLAESKSAATERLQLLFLELDEVYSDATPSDPTLAAFQTSVRRANIPRLYPEQMLLGMQMDTQGVHYQTQDELMLYCYRVAGTVGLMMSHVLGLSDPGGLTRAAHMGMAMQITNICRDVREDFERQRVYLPQDALERHGAGELTARLEDGIDALESSREPLRAVLREQLSVAARYYASGDAGLGTLDSRPRFAIASARLIYSAIGTSLERGGFDVMAPRAYVTTAKKLWLVTRGVKHLFQATPFQPCSRLPELSYERLEKL